MVKKPCHTIAGGIIVVIGVFLLFLFLPTSAQADSQDTLWVASDGPTVQWDEEIGCSAGDDYTCIDEQNALDDADYLHVGLTNQVQDWKFGVPGDTSGVLDSVGFVVRATSTSAVEDLLFRSTVNLTEGGWTACGTTAEEVEDVPSDFTTYEFVHTQDCVVGGGAANITWAMLADTANHCWGVITDGTVGKGAQLQVSWSCLVYYYHTAGNPRRNREQRSKLRGGIDEENFDFYARFDPVAYR